MAQVPRIGLNNGVEMPQLGFGVWQVPDERTPDAVAAALEAGYRSIDTAAMYHNEAGVGRAVAASGLPREELFITTKLWNDDHGYDATMRAFEASLRNLGLDYLDLYLIHWPVPGADRYVDTWRAFEKLQADGRVRAIGVSNFQIPHLHRLFDETDTVPVVNQIELHPRLPQEALRAFHAEHGIATEAWSPLARGGDLLRHPEITALAEKHGKTPAQIVLRWHLQLGNVVIPKSATPARIKENIDVFDFELDQADLERIATLDDGTRIGPHPDRFGA
ncbi:aldo/keto reductase [Gandjariella thermophila]|uniref:Oxidoreductase n=1 Tax=Gandjariella thermophila TaxID=1931992 RepID=A0A4D4J6D9_9PSEU|nr:aldo/keto reductase [Gandjariella thermophila]GDY29537.1 oxidoreductase [Gandjariella thermophila]